MSDKPKIYGFCKAGCQWETVHKSDFEKSASHIIQNISEDGNYYLETGKEYKIFAPKGTDNYNFDCSLMFAYTDNGTAVTQSLSFINTDKYAESFVFRLLEATATDTILTLVYELGGTRYTEYINGSSLTLLSEKYLYVNNATKVLMYNADAEVIVRGEKGEKGEKGDSGLATGATLSNTEGASDVNGYTQYGVNNIIGKPNLFINPDFKVNQRGQSSYSVSGKTQYTVDRWQVSSDGTINVTPNSQGSISLDVSAVGSTGYGWIAQYIEHLPAGSYTVTWKINSADNINPNNRMFVHNAVTSSYIGVTVTVVDSNTVVGKFTLNSSASNVRIGLQIKEEVGTSLTIYSAKLEEGNISTAFESPNLASEILKCQRYYIRYGSNPYSVFPLGIWNSGYQPESTYYNVISITLPTPTDLRATNSVNFVGDFRFQKGDKRMLLVPSIRAQVSDKYSGCVIVTCTARDTDAVFSIGDVGQVLAYNPNGDTTNRYIEIDAEIY